MPSINKYLGLICSLVMLPTLGVAQNASTSNTNDSKFRQLKQELPTPNRYRTASGYPGPAYYQQQADYQIDVRLDDQNQVLYGEETITYTNRAPESLRYLWVQLDQNVRAKDSYTHALGDQKIKARMSPKAVRNLEPWFDGGFKIDYVRDRGGDPLPHTVNQTMMRVELEEPLETGESFSFRIKYHYKINDRMKIGGRSGYEYFPQDGNYLYTIAQFYPRMAVYNDVEGWQNKQFLGRGEFALPFGDYEVRITVPADHIVAATGRLQNENDVLTDRQQERLERSRETTDKPVIIVTEEEARKNEQKGTDRTQTWVFEAENVRDFAFASSRKFIWDAKAVPFDDRKVMAMSYYPKEGNPLWERYSTEVVAHTLKHYSQHTFAYPYHKAISVHSRRIGMEYPMICFNYGRPEADGTYSERMKYGMISVIIHEIGHNFFPMIVNSDERQWTWMDEGLNTFLQYLTEQAWEANYPSRRGPAYKMTQYMKGDEDFIAPIMTNSESIYQFGNNAYGKPATALNILRETVMGRELFDYAFKQYAQTWKFKHPTPADFFRIMEDASAVDLDWFWRGWFYTTDHVDIALEEVKWYQLEDGRPEAKDRPLSEAERKEEKFITNRRNDTSLVTRVEEDTALADFYTRINRQKVTRLDREEARRYRASLDEEAMEILEAGKHYYEMHFRNVGGLVMPIILEFTYQDGSKEKKYLPAEAWLKNEEEVSKVFVTDQPLKQVELDPNLETADTDRSNNYWPAQQQPTRFELFMQSGQSRPNKMQQYRAIEAEKEAQPEN
jgi:hypothetical protein